jgi:hypothetical protein
VGEHVADATLLSRLVWLHSQAPTGSLWRHKSTGGVYRVTAHSLLQVDGPHDLAPAVSYERERRDGLVFTRPSSDWFERFAEVPHAE